MTREVAIRRLLNIERSLPNTFRTKEDVRNFEALEMAIETLKQEPLTEEDYKELHDRFGAYVEFVVRDMVGGKGERWTQKGDNNPQYCDRNICVSNEYNGIGCDECEVTKSQEPKTDYIAHGIDGNLYKLTISNGKEFEQEPKTGHWIYICNSAVNGLKIVKCSECGKRTYGRGNYCPHCGAKMEVEKWRWENDRTMARVKGNYHRNA